MERQNKKGYRLMAVCLLSAVSVTACAHEGAMNTNAASGKNKMT